MKIFKSKTNLQKYLNTLKQENTQIGFVPTMGSLHKGHISLIKKSVEDNDITVASIFVNPTQFNDKNDLKNYPRNNEVDCEILEKAFCNVVFIPSVEEMYPKEESFSPLNLEGLDRVMEGTFRTGHFDGVVQIVSKLFKIIMPHKAYFGEKDFQQLAVIRFLVKKANLSIQIIACSTIREKDGLAMSSRNQLLTPEQRKDAAQISKILFETSQELNNLPFSEIKKQVRSKINSFKNLELEYFEIADENSLKNSDNFNSIENLRCFIAVKAGNVRLIDNIKALSLSN